MLTELMTGIAVTTMAITGVVELVDAIKGSNSEECGCAEREKYDLTHETRMRRLREAQRARAAERDMYSPIQQDYFLKSLAAEPIQHSQLGFQQQYIPAPAYPQPCGYPMQQPVLYAPAPLLQQGSAVFQQPAYNYPGAAPTVTMTTNDLYEFFVKAVNYGISVGQNSIPQQPPVNAGL